jgi:hypothetical protein
MAGALDTGGVGADVRTAACAAAGRVGDGETVGGDEADEVSLRRRASAADAPPLRTGYGLSPPYDACSAEGAALTTWSEPVPWRA